MIRAPVLVGFDRESIQQALNFLAEMFDRDLPDGTALHQHLYWNGMDWQHEDDITLPKGTRTFNIEASAAGVDGGTLIFNAGAKGAGGTHDGDVWFGLSNTRYVGLGSSTNGWRMNVAGNMLEFVPGGSGQIRLPQSFWIGAGQTAFATPGTGQVTAPNLNTVTAGPDSNADQLHTHAPIILDVAPADAAARAVKMIARYGFAVVGPSPTGSDDDPRMQAVITACIGLGPVTQAAGTWHSGATAYTVEMLGDGVIQAYNPTIAAQLAQYSVGPRFGKVVLAPLYSSVAWQINGGFNAVYVPGTTYALNEVVAVPDAAPTVNPGKVYRSLQAGNTGHTPSSSPTWWVEMPNDLARIVAVASVCSTNNWTLHLSTVGLWVGVSNVDLPSPLTIELGDASFIQALQTANTYAFFHARSVTAGAAIALQASNTPGTKTVSIATPLPALGLVCILNGNLGIGASPGFRGGVYRVVSHTGATPDVLTLDRVVLWQWDTTATCQPLASISHDITIKGDRAKFYGIGSGIFQSEYAWDVGIEGVDVDASAMGIGPTAGVVINHDTGSLRPRIKNCNIFGHGTNLVYDGFGFQGCEDWTLEDCTTNGMAVAGVLVTDVLPGTISRGAATNNLSCGVRLSSHVITSNGCQGVKIRGGNYSGNVDGIQLLVADGTVLDAVDAKYNTVDVNIYSVSGTGWAANTQIIGGPVAADLTKLTLTPCTTAGAYLGVAPGTTVNGCPIFREMHMATVNDMLRSSGSANKPGLTAGAGSVAVAYRRLTYSADHDNVVTVGDGAQGWGVQLYDATPDGLDLMVDTGTTYTTALHLRLALGEVIFDLFTIAAGVGAGKAYCGAREGTAADQTGFAESVANSSVGVGNGTTLWTGQSASINHAPIGFATCRVTLTLAQVAQVILTARESGPEAGLLALAAYTNGWCYLMADHVSAAVVPRVGNGPNLADVGTPTFVWRRFQSTDLLYG